MVVVIRCDLVLHGVRCVCGIIVVGLWLVCGWCGVGCQACDKCGCCVFVCGLFVVGVVLGVRRVINVVVVWFARGKIMFGDVVARQH